MRYLLILAIVLSFASPARGSQPPEFIILKNDTVVATAVATNAPYNADRTGKIDATLALQHALDDVAALGGGVVYLPEGRYRLNGELKIGYSVTLRGAGSGGADHAGETLLMACGAQGDKPLLDARAVECGLIGISIWYPNQWPEDVAAYSFAICAGPSAQLKDILLYNAFNGIELTNASSCVVENVRGTVLRRGIVAPLSVEFSWIHDVEFANHYWREAATWLCGAAMSPSALAALDGYTARHLVGLELGRLDGMAIYRFRADNAHTPIRIEKNTGANQHQVFGYGGVAGGLPGPVEEFGWDPWYYGMHYANLDNVPEVAGKSYTFAAVPGPARRDPGAFIDVKAPPYAAVGNGVADDTNAIQKALNSMGQQRGGTVYLGPGIYRVTRPLIVPAGVELRGALGMGKARSYKESCSIAAYVSRSTDKPEADPALLTLMDHAGVRGIEIVYPEQPYDVGKLAAYPFTIRGNGAGVWICDVILINAYNGIDLATNRCDGHRVIGVWGLAFQKGLVVGGGSRDGVLERVAFSYGPWTESGRAPNAERAAGGAAIAEYCRQHSTHYTFGSCAGERAWGLVGFDPNVHIRFASDSGAGCSNTEFWMTMFDVAHRTCLDLESGSDIRFYGLFATGGGGDPTQNWLETGPAFVGPLHVYAKTIQSSFLNHPYTFSPSQVQFHDETALTTGRPATLVPANTGRDVASAVDRDWRTVCELPSGTSLQVDLGAPHTIDRFGIESGRLSSATAPIIREVELSVSLNGINFTPAGRLQTWGYPWADRPIEPITARYVRLRVTSAEGKGVPTLATFSVYGPRG